MSSSLSQGRFVFPVHLCRNFQRAWMDDVTQLTPTQQILQSLAIFFEFFSKVIFPVLLWLELYCIVYMLCFSSLTPPCLLLLAVRKPPPFWSLVYPPLPWIILKFSDVTVQLWTWRFFFGTRWNWQEFFCSLFLALVTGKMKVPSSFFFF